MKDDICGDVGRVLLSLVDIVVRLEYTVIMIIIVHFQRITHTWSPGPKQRIRVLQKPETDIQYLYLYTYIYRYQKPR